MVVTPCSIVNGVDHSGLDLIGPLAMASYVACQGINVILTGRANLNIKGLNVRVSHVGMIIDRK